MLWILQNDFSQEWGLKPSCFFKCTSDRDKDQKEMLDRYALKVVGDDPAGYGYVKIEGDAVLDGEDNRIVFCCDGWLELEFVYDRICDAFLNHPGVIDLRGEFDIRII